MQCVCLSFTFGNDGIGGSCVLEFCSLNCTYIKVCTWNNKPKVQTGVPAWPPPCKGLSPFCHLISFFSAKLILFNDLSGYFNFCLTCYCPTSLVWRYCCSKSRPMAKIMGASSLPLGSSTGPTNMSDCFHWTLTSVTTHRGETHSGYRVFFYSPPP